MDCFKGLEKQLLRFIVRFPSSFDKRLHHGLYQLLGNVSEEFIISRSSAHLKRLLFAQFFLKKKMETIIADSGGSSSCCAKVFVAEENTLCVAFCYSLKQKRILAKYLLSTLLEDQVSPAYVIPNSSYSWHSQSPPYAFQYVELQKLRGLFLTCSEMRSLQTYVEDSIPQVTGSKFSPVFHPYNIEEFYRQLMALQAEIDKKEDFPHVSIHFHKQHEDSLEFLVYIVASFSFDQSIVQSGLPSSISLIRHLCRELNQSPFLEGNVFSIMIPVPPLQDKGIIDLLCARRVVAQHVQAIVGPIRDFNERLFENGLF